MAHFLGVAPRLLACRLRNLTLQWLDDLPLNVVAHGASRPGLLRRCRRRLIRRIRARPRPHAMLVDDDLARPRAKGRVASAPHLHALLVDDDFRAPRTLALGLDAHAV